MYIQWDIHLRSNNKIEIQGRNVNETNRLHMPPEESGVNRNRNNHAERPEKADDGGEGIYITATPCRYCQKESIITKTVRRNHADCRHDGENGPKRRLSHSEKGKVNTWFGFGL